MRKIIPQKALTVYEIREFLEELPFRSAWEWGVRDYSCDLFEWWSKDWEHLETWEVPSRKISERILLNGATDWVTFSKGGNSLVYDEDICGRLCSESKQKAKRYGKLPPSRNATWLDLQAIALSQAAKIVCDVVNRCVTNSRRLATA